jgi:cyclohexadieny/prephenate dehydrogenase
MPNTILTDVGSTKLNVVKIFSKLKNVKFNILPAHPIAGTEKSGPESGFAELFNKRWCIITPMGKNNKNSLNKLKKLWNIFGSKVQIMNAKNHDKILAITSHMPHLISYAIVFSSLNANAKEKSQIIKFSAGGFRDFTRIAASDATMWKDIFLNNKKNLLKTVNEFEKSLNLIKQYIKQNKSKKIQEVFIKTKKIRKLIEKEKQE